jgi:PAS domain S-box-containing protein
VEAQKEQLLSEYDLQRRRAERLAVEARMRADELEAIIEALTDAVVVYDSAGSPLRSNAAATALLGMEHEAGAGSAAPMQRLVIHRPDGSPLPAEELPWVAALRGEVACQERLVLTNHEKKTLTVSISASPLWSDRGVSGVVALWRDLTEHDRLTVLEERQHLARELHDSLSQVLYGIALGAHTINAQLNHDRPRVAEALAYLLKLVDAGLTEMRALIFELRPETLAAEGLVTALGRQMAAMRIRHGIEVQAELEQEPEVSLDVKQALYRVAQESLHNAVKHARASRLDLRLGQQDGQVLLEVRDNGVGFDPQAAYPGHLGLRSMQERASRLGGKLRIHSAPGHGTRVQVCFPKTTHVRLPQSLASPSPPAGPVLEEGAAA